MYHCGEGGRVGEVVFWLQLQDSKFQTKATFKKGECSMIRFNFFICAILKAM